MIEDWGLRVVMIDRKQFIIRFVFKHATTTLTTSILTSVLAMLIISPAIFRYRLRYVTGHG